MALSPWRFGWSWFDEVDRQMDDVMRRAFRGRLPAEVGAAQTSTWVPAVDVFARGSDLVVRAELPGVDPERDVDITVENGILTVRGERRQEERREDERYFRLERSYGAFERSVPLPEDVKAEEIEASYRDGVLEVRVPRAAQVTGARRRIPVTTGSQPKTIEARATDVEAKKESKPRRALRREK